MTPSDPTDPTRTADPAHDDPAWSALAIALDEVDPPAALRSRLLASVERPAQRFAPFLDRLAAMIDVGVERAHSLLESIADPAAWSALLPGVELMHLEGGPAVAGADVGFVRVAPGVRFPYHHHHGDERVLLLAGMLTDDDGSSAAPGAALYKAPGTSHSVISSGDTPLIYAVVVHDVEIPGLSIHDD